jgi:hypothetical protein
MDTFEGKITKKTFTKKKGVLEGESEIQKIIEISNRIQCVGFKQITLGFRMGVFTGTPDGKKRKDPAADFQDDLKGRGLCLQLIIVAGLIFKRGMIGCPDGTPTTKIGSMGAIIDMTAFAYIRLPGIG